MEVWLLFSDYSLKNNREEIKTKKKNQNLLEIIHIATSEKQTFETKFFHKINKS